MPCRGGFEAGELRDVEGVQVFAYGVVYADVLQAMRWGEGRKQECMSISLPLVHIVF